MRKIIFLSLLILALSCRSTEKELTAQNKEEIISEVNTMFDEYFSAVRENGLTAEFEFLDSSEDFFWVPPGFRSALSYDSVVVSLTRNSKKYKQVDFRWVKLDIHPLNYEIATYTGILNGKLLDTAGKVTQATLIESGTIIKRGRAWKILSGQSQILL